MNKRYGIFRFLVDLILGCLTGGLWWLYLLFKFLRRNS